jgi:hypothetical protein
MLACDLGTLPALTPEGTYLTGCEQCSLICFIAAYHAVPSRSHRILCNSDLLLQANNDTAVSVYNVSKILHVKLDLRP